MSSTPKTSEVCDGIEPANKASTHGVEDRQVDKSGQPAPREAQAALENLPSELRRQILFSIGDLRTLRSLVRASPAYHEQYRLDRDNLLHHCLESELGGISTDAFATARSRVRKLGQQRTNDDIAIFLEYYLDCLSEPHHSQVAASFVMSISSSDIQWLCSFHLAVALPLSEFFCHWAYTNLTRAAASSENAVQGEIPAAHKMDLSSISDSERLRIMRALYRCETYYHLFGRNDGIRIGFFLNSDIVEIFLTIFEPWEAEEIGCIDLFIKTKYASVFNQVKADLHPQSPRFDDQRGGCPDPDGSYELDKFWDDYISGTMSRGLETTARILAVINDHDRLVDEMATCLTPFHHQDASMSDSLSSKAQFDRRHGVRFFPNPERGDEGRDLLPFPGDVLPPTGPPSAWVILWRGNFVNLFGAYIPAALKEYGWVVWDACRLDSMGVRKLIADQWKAAPRLLEEIEVAYPWLSGVGEDDP